MFLSRFKLTSSMMRFLSLLLLVHNVYLDHLKFCVVCINSRRYVCCGECYVVSNESCTVVKLSTLVAVLTLGVSLVS